MHKIALVICVFLATSAGTTAQNLQNLTPSFILRKGQVELKPYFNLYTQTRFYDGSASRLDAGNRATYFTTIFQTLYGVNSKLNIGLDAFIKSTISDFPNTSPLAALRMPNNIPASRAAVTKVGPRIKMPIGGLSSRFSFQSTFFFPTAPDLQGATTAGPYLDHDGFLWWTQFFSDNKIGEKLNLFAEIDLLVQLDRRFASANSSIGTPLKLFVSHFATKRFSWYVMSDFTPTYGTNTFLSSWYWQNGMGFKIQLNNWLEVEFLHSEFMAGKSAGAGSTYNIGLRIVR